MISASGLCNLTFIAAISASSASTTVCSDFPFAFKPTTNSASKFALNGLIEALRSEVAPHGIDVTILHLGDFKTQISSKQVCTRNAVVTSPYHSAFEKTVGLYDRNVRMGRLPDIAARKIEIYCRATAFLCVALLAPGLRSWLLV